MLTACKRKSTCLKTAIRNKKRKEEFIIDISRQQSPNTMYVLNFTDFGIIAKDERVARVRFQYAHI